MTTNAHTHCPTCMTAAREMMREEMAEVIMDDEDIEFDDAVKRIVPAVLEEQTIEYLDGIIAEQRNTLTTRPSTCVFIHNDLTD